MALIQPLDLQQLLVNVFAGNMYIFVFLMIILIATLAAKFRMNTLSFGLVISLFAIVMGAWANWLLFIVVIVGGIAIYFSLSRVLMRS